jgi:hypothetical protein
MTHKKVRRSHYKCVLSLRRVLKTRSITMCWLWVDFKITCTLPLKSGYRIRIRMDPLYFWKLDLDLDPDFGEELFPDPHLSQNSEALEAEDSAGEGRGRSQWRPGGTKWSSGGSIDQWSQIQTGPIYYVFCRLYPFSPQPSRYCFGSYLSSLTSTVSPVRARLST